MDEQKSITVINQEMEATDLKNQHRQLKAMVKSVFKETKTGEGGDYGVIPYTKKISLLKPGAEKLCKLYGFVPSYECLDKVEDWKSGFVFYKYKCTLTHFGSGKTVGDSTRSCNNKEKKHASKSVYDVANTVEAVAQKRALVAAVVQATMASDIFDADTGGDFDTEAPNKKTTAIEDPRRNALTMRLYGVASEHGLSNKWIHAAIKKKWSVDSLTKLSNEQIEELHDLIIKTYKKVGKGGKAELINSGAQIAKQAPEVVEDGDHLFCRQCGKTGTEALCSEACKDAYFPKTTPVNLNDKLKAFKQDILSKGAAV